MKKITGNVPGWSYSFGPIPRSSCSLCGRENMPLLRAMSVCLCEPCSMLLAWVWRDYEGTNVPGTAYSKEVGFVLVVIVRERVNDTLHPFDVLMVERKDEPGAFGLPGGKVQHGETSAEAAVRELAEETKVATWPSALEPLYAGYSPRATLGEVFLCRGYEGEPEEGTGPEGTEIAWKPWPPADHAKHLAGYYVGVALAFDARWRAQRQAAARTPLSLQLGEPAVAYLDRRLAQLDGVKKPDTERMLESFANVMSVEEKETTQIIMSTAERSRSMVVRAPESTSFRPPAEDAGNDVAAEEPSGDGEYAGDGDDEADSGSGFTRTDYVPPKRTPP